MEEVRNSILTNVAYAVLLVTSLDIVMFDYFINNANSVMAAYGLYDYLFPFGSWVLPSLMKSLGKLLKSFPYASTTTGHVVSASTLRK